MTIGREKPKILEENAVSVSLGPVSHEVAWA